MSKKKLDSFGRWRNKTIAFRVSPEENSLINEKVKLSGLTKQEYLCKNMLNETITVIGSPRIYKALKSYFLKVAVELKSKENKLLTTKEFNETFKLALQIYKDLGGEET